MTALRDEYGEKYANLLFSKKFRVFVVEALKDPVGILRPQSVHF